LVALLPTLLESLPELGMLDRRQIAALVGVDQMTRDRGKWRGKALTACMRTLLTTLNAMMKHRTSWQTNNQKTPCTT